MTLPALGAVVLAMLVFPGTLAVYVLRFRPNNPSNIWKVWGIFWGAILIAYLITVQNQLNQ